jgi:hypothetical protein
MSAMSNIWGDSKAQFMVYDSSDYGANFTLRAPRLVPVSMWPGKIAMRASDGAYVGIFVEDKLRNDAPEMHLTIGVVGANPTVGAKKWTRPYLPAVVACDGTKFVLFTEGNRVYHSTDRINWTLKGNLPANFQMLYSERLPGGLTGNAVASPPIVLEWLPLAQIWIYKDTFGLFYTTDVNALTGWAPWWSTIEKPVPGPGIVYTPQLLSATDESSVPGLVEINANLMYMRIEMSYPNLNPGYLTGWGNYTRPCVHKSVDKGVTWTLVAADVSWYPVQGIAESPPGVFTIANHATDLDKRFNKHRNVRTVHLPSGIKNISDTKYVKFVSDAPEPSGNWYYSITTTVDCLGFD